MTDGPPTRADAATAGISVIVVMIAAAAVEYALGSPADLAVPTALIGLLAGVGGGLALVHARFRRI